MKLVVAPEAAAQILARKRWWRANRSKAPARFGDELAAALTAITERPESFPVFSARGGRTVRRCLLAKTRCHIYFEVLRETDEVWVTAARGAVQRRPPKLAPR
jgi:plasmid stabilization system protein ParE